MKFYAHPDQPHHIENIAKFTEILRDFPQLAVFQPSPEKAPWHWQAVIDLGGYVQVINFWPHTMKAQRDGFKSVQGDRAVRGIIKNAFAEGAREDDFDFDLLEDYE